MRFLALVTRIILFVLLLGFAAKNSETVDVRYFLGLEWQVPLSLLLLIVFSLGVVLGLFANSRRLVRQRLELRRARADLRKAETANTES